MSYGDAFIPYGCYLFSTAFSFSIMPVVTGIQQLSTSGLIVADIICFDHLGNDHMSKCRLHITNQLQITYHLHIKEIWIFDMNSNILHYIHELVDLQPKISITQCIPI